MALSYTDVYKTDEFVSRVQDIKNEIENQKNSTENTLFFARNMIEEEIKILEKKEKALLDLFGKNMTLEELNKKIQAYREQTFSFNGPALESAFTDVLDKKNQESNKKFEKAVRTVIQKTVITDVKKYVGSEGLKKAKNAVLNFINKGLDKTRIKFVATSGIQIGRNGKVEFFPNSFTEAQQNRWKDILKREEFSNIPDVQKYLDSLQVTITNTEDTMRAEFTWFDKEEGTNRLTSEQAKKLSGTERSNINRNIINLIKSNVSGNVNMPVLEAAIQDVLTSSNGLAFFVGRNVNKIIGILGEIQGIYYLRLLLGDNAKVIWRGGLNTGAGNANPHQDIQVVFKQAFGIQIKNTTSEIDIMKDLGVKKDLNKNISFTEGSISHMVEMMSQVTGIVDEELIGLIETYYGTKSFNIPYHYETQGGIRQAVPNNKILKVPRKTKKNGEKVEFIKNWNKKTTTYIGSRQELESLNSDINLLMSTFAAAFMYLDAFDLNSEQDLNIIYLIGGSAFVLASQVLQKVLADLESKSTNPHFTMTLHKTDDNIITAINSGGKNSYTSSIINQIKLTSAYKF